MQALASPAGPNSGEPQLSVSSKGVLLSWVEREGSTASLKFAERTSAGWSAVRTVASGDNWFVNWADVPSVMHTHTDSPKARKPRSGSWHRIYPFWWSGMRVRQCSGGSFWNTCKSHPYNACVFGRSYLCLQRHSTGQSAGHLSRSPYHTSSHISAST